MILQALAEYYERKPKAEEAADGLPPVGMEENGIGFVIVIDTNGQVVNVEDLREPAGRIKRARPMIVPMSCDRTGKDAWKTAFLLWDYPRYVLGIRKEGDVPEMGEKRINSFRQAIAHAFPDSAVDPGVKAVCAFYDHFDDNQTRLKNHASWPALEGTNLGISFRLRDVPGELVCQSPLVRQRARTLFEEDAEAPVGVCLITGETGAVQTLHPATPIAGAKAGAKVLSFNERAYESYGKRERKGENAPVGKRAAFAYTTALNYLLRAGSQQKLRIGDATTVFWADHNCSFEDDFAAFFDEPRKDDPDPDRGTRAIAALLESAKQGVGPALDDRTRFFVLGLAPNSARIAIRFWHVGTVAEMAGQIVRHFRDLEMTWLPGKQNRETGFLPVSRLLKAVAFDFKVENAPPNLGGEIMHAILQGQPYPETLFQNAIRRIRMERDVGYPRAAILKACLNRKSKPNEKEIIVSLDKDNTNSGYRLGRLFAVLERVQEEASHGLNATIRDRYYGAFSATPASVFATLMRMKNHHLAKLDNPGRRANLEKLIGEIVDGLPPAPPAHLSLSDQGRFAIGYYHQRMDPGTYKSPAKENDNG